MDFVLKKELETSGQEYVEVIVLKKPSEARKIQKSRKIIIVKPENDETARVALENKNIDILIGLELINEKDFIHSRNSGLNQVLCKLAKKNNIAIGFNFNYLKNNKKEVILGKIMQNVFLCRKYKIKMVLGSFATKETETRNRSELMSFGKIIGMNGKEIKESLNFGKKEDNFKIIR